MPEKKVATSEKKPASSSDLDTLQGIYEQFGRPVLFALAGALVIVTVFLGYKNKQAAKLGEASDLYWTARTPQELESIPEDYPKSPLAPLARLKAAKLYFDNGQYAQALNLYRDFQEQHPDHFMADTARMGEWHSREMLGQIQEALRSFARFAEEQPDHFLTPQAVLGHARCLETLGRHEEARAVYDLFLAAERHPAWTDAVKGKLNALKRRRSQPATSVTLPIPPAPSQDDTEPVTEAEAPATDLPPLITIPDFNSLPPATP